MDETQDLRLERAIAVARRVMELSAEDRTRALTYLAGMVPISVENAVNYVLEGVK